MEKHLDASEKTPIALENGPIGNGLRTNTDIFYCVLFLLVLFGMFGVGIYAFKNGDPMKLN